MPDNDQIEVVVTRNGIKEPPRYYPADRLQELMDRANAAFGNPDEVLGGPEAPNPEGVSPNRIQRRKR